MKELSVEEKAKRYDEAIERAKKWYNAPNVDKIPTFGNRVIEEIFPELKESEDERVKEELKEVLGECLNVRPQIVEEKQYMRLIAWIERQCEKGTNGNNREFPFSEQKPAWREEDEKMFDYALNMIDWYGCVDKDKSKPVSDWLKSFKDRYTWKPNESDVRILEQVIDGTANPINYHATLHAILEQLKKLREE